MTITWTNKKPTDYLPLWSSTVLPWQESTPWQWELVNDDIDNNVQNNQN